jgi:phosphoglycolate phosphatase
VRAVILDMDGTLIDTPSGIAAVIESVLVERGRNGVPLAQVRSKIGRPLETIFAELLGEGEDAPAVGHAVHRYREAFAERILPHAAELVFPDVEATLRRWRDSDLRLAVATSKIRKTAGQLLAGAHLDELLDAVVCHDMVEHGKPDPEMGLLAAKLIDVDPDDCVLVGDAVDDIRLGVAAGMTTIGVSYGAGTRDELESAGAHHIADSFREVAELVENSRRVDVR